MVSRFAFIFCFLFASVTLYAGDTPTIHLTGNPSVDFFSDLHNSSRVMAGNDDSLPPTELMPSGSSRKSPWIAGLLSLAVPGAGEVYTQNYFKGAVFLAIEAASWITIYTYNKKGDRQTDVFMDYANAHWSAARYARWMEYNFNLDENQYDLFNGSPDADCLPPFDCVNWINLDAAKDTIFKYNEGSGFTHSLPYWGQQQYYELIGKYPQFSKGWDSQLIPNGGGQFDPTDYREGNPQFDSYREMFNQADKYYDVASSFVSVVVVNHILSAIDAAWSATRYNSNLRAEIETKMIPTRRGFVTMARAKIQYSF